MPSILHIPAWFKALFAGTEGDIVIQGVGTSENLLSRDINEIMAFLARVGEADVDLITEVGHFGEASGVGGFSMRSNISDAEATWDATLEPSLVVKDAEGFLHGIYLIEMDKRRAAVVKAILTQYQDASNVAPLPIGSCIAAPEDIAAAAAVDLTIYSVDDIEQGFTVLAVADNTPEISAETAENEVKNTPLEDEKVESSEDNKFQDATVINGDRIPADYLLTPIKISVGGRRSAAKWHLADKWTITNLIEQLTLHKEGEKDGPSILQGYTPSGERKKELMTELYFAGLDIDCGMPIEEGIKRIEALDLFCIIYTTHSHHGTTSEISVNKYLTFAREHNYPDDPTPAALAHYLLSVKHYTETIAKSAHPGSVTEDGKNFLIEHAPMDRYRVIFPLVAPFVFADQKKEINSILRRLTSNEAQNRWKFKMLGLAEIVGVPIDNSCTDASRLFYLPRHKPGRSGWSIVVIGGKPLNLELVPEKNPRDEAQEQDVFAQAAARMGANAKGALYLPSGLNLAAWAKENSRAFQMAQVFEACCPERIRNHITPSKLEVECPFDGEHSNPGDTEDRGTFICDAASEGNEGGFIFKCQHNGCSGRDRLDLLREAILSDFFPETAITDPIYLDSGVIAEENVGTFKDDEAAAAAEKEKEEEDGGIKQDTVLLKEIGERISSFTKTTSADAVEKTIQDIHRASALPFTVKSLLKDIRHKTGHDRSDLNEISRTAYKLNARSKVKKNKREAPGQRLDRLMAATGTKPRLNSKGIPTVGLMLSELGYDECRDLVISKFKDYNDVNPIVFRFANERIRCIIGKEGQPEMEGLTHAVVRDTLREAVTLWEEGPDGDPQTQKLDDDLAEDISKAMGLDPPALNGFATLPFLTKAGTLISKGGFNKDTGLFLRLPAGFELPPIPENPSPQQIADSRDYLLQEVYCDFPFDDGPDSDTHGAGSRAHFMSMLLHPAMKALAGGLPPFFYVTKPRMGSGATLLVSTALRIGTGEAASAQVLSRDDNEVRKLVTSYFMSGKTAIWFDNPTTKVSSEPLMVLATAETWNDRGLGHNTVHSFPNNIMGIISGNNLKFAADLTRRGIPIRLDPKTDPLKRDINKFKIRNLERFVESNQRILYAHCLTLVNAWIAAGFPLWHERALPTYEAWSETMGGILDVIGMSDGFLNNLHLTTEVNEDDENWARICTAWFKIKQFDPISGKDLTKLYCDMEEPPDFANFPSLDLPDAVHPKFIKLLREKRDNPFTIETEGGALEVAIRRKSDRKGEKFFLAIPKK